MFILNKQYENKAVYIVRNPLNLYSKKIESFANDKETKNWTKSRNEATNIKKVLLTILSLGKFWLGL